MTKEAFHYTNGEITVVWKPQSCIHSTKCWKGLIEVFNPKEKPWIKMEGGTTEKIMDQVEQCPSGALSFFKNEESESPANRVNDVKEENTGLSKIQVTPGGPYLVTASCVIINSDGTEETKNGTVALCRCGASKNKPYCDGSHRHVVFDS